MFLLSTKFLEKWQPKIECLWSLVNTGLYAVTIGFISGTDGPGGKIGNMYYFMWLSFVTSAYLSLECCNELFVASADQEGGEKEKDAGTVGEHHDEEQHQEETQEDIEKVEVKDGNVAANV